MAREQVDFIVSSALHGRGIWVADATRSADQVRIRASSGLVSWWIVKLTFADGLLRAIAVATEDGTYVPDGLPPNEGLECSWPGSEWRHDWTRSGVEVAHDALGVIFGRGRAVWDLARGARGV